MKPTFHWSVEENHPRPRWLAVLDYQQRNISRIQPVPVATFVRWRSRAASVAHLRNQKTRPPMYTYISLWYASFSTTIIIPDCHCGIYFVLCVFIRLQRSIWSMRGYETGQRNIERNTSGSGIFFLTSLLDTDWISIRGKSFYFHCIDGKKKRNYKMEKKKIKEDVCDVKFIGSRYIIIIRYYYIIIKWYKF